MFINSWFGKQRETVNATLHFQIGASTLLVSPSIWRLKFWCRIMFLRYVVSLHFVLLNIVLSFCLSNLLSIGPIRRCLALDSTSSGRCTRTAVGLHTFGWRHMVYNVSCDFRPSQYLITLKAYLRCSCIAYC